MLVRFAAPGSGETGFLVLLRPDGVFAEVLQLGLVVVAGVALALAGRDGSEFVSPSLSLGTGHLDALRAGVGRDAAIIRGVLPPPFPSADGVGQEVRRDALTRAHQLLDGLDAAARALAHVAGGPHLSAAEVGSVCEQRNTLVTTFFPVLEGAFWLFFFYELGVS